MRKTIDKIVRQVINEYYDREDIGPKKRTNPYFDGWKDNDEDDDEPDIEDLVFEDIKRQMNSMK